MTPGARSGSTWKLIGRYPLRTFCTSLRFLTIVPVSWKMEEDHLFFRSSVIWFPFVGLLIGLAAATVVMCAAPFIPASLLAVLAMFLLSGFSGFLHLDGLADSGDGLLSSRPRERALAIMRDSRSGAMGVIALIFLLLAKYAALSTLSPPYLFAALLLMPIGGRTAILVCMALLPYARKEEEGLGQLFYSSQRYTAAGVGTLFFLFSCVIFLGSETVYLFILYSLTLIFFSYFCFRKLGGATGDTLGAVCELSELSIAVAVVSVQTSL